MAKLPDATRLNLTVQKLLHIWLGEAAIGVMALSEVPTLLALQLNRFHGTLEHPDAASTTDSPPKDTSRVILDTRISLPSFRVFSLCHHHTLSSLWTSCSAHP